MRTEQYIILALDGHPRENGTGTERPPDNERRRRFNYHASIEWGVNVNEGTRLQLTR